MLLVSVKGPGTFQRSRIMYRVKRGEEPQPCGVGVWVVSLAMYHAATTVSTCPPTKGGPGPHSNSLMCFSASSPLSHGIWTWPPVLLHPQPSFYWSHSPLSSNESQLQPDLFLQWQSSKCTVVMKQQQSLQWHWCSVQYSMCISLTECTSCLWDSSVSSIWGGEC